MMKPSAMLASFLVLGTLLSAQSIGTPVNVLFPTNSNLLPGDQDLVVSEDGSFVAGIGSLPSIADVVIVDISPSGVPTMTTNVLFPSANDVSNVNRTLVASRRGHFLCCYGSNGVVGDLVFITRNGSSWVATNVVFPAGNEVPAVGTKPVISDDEDFILCRGSSGIGDFVIIPVLFAVGVYSPGTPFNKAAPGGNTIPLSAIDPVIAPNSLSFVVTTTTPSLGDLMIGTIAKPISAANTTIVNLFFPAANNVLSTLARPVASPKSNYWAAFGQPLIGDLVVIPMDASGVPGTPVNVLFPGANNLGYSSLPPPPPAISGDGRLIAMNGSDSNLGDVVLVPMDVTGAPGTPSNVAFPLSNNVSNLQLPPVVSAHGDLVVHRGSPTIGDLVAIQVTFSTSTPITLTSMVQNVLYPLNNNVPATDAHVALAPDQSYAVTLGTGTIGDIVITPFDPGGIAQTPINVLYPLANNVPNLGTTPRISREGNLILTSGASTIGDAVVTGVAVDYTTHFVKNIFTSNVIYPLSNHNSPTTREPVFSPTTQFAVSAGTSTVGDIVVIPLLDPFPRFLARADTGMTVPVRIFSPPDAGKFVIIAAAAGRNFGFPIIDGRIVPLNNDSVLAFSLSIPNPVFTNYGAVVGPLDPNGIFLASVTVPPVDGNEGIFFYTAFVVFDPAASLGIGTISRASVLVVE